MNSDEFGRVVTAHTDRVHSYAAWMLQDLEDARDVTQETLMRLWGHRGKVHHAAAGTWMLRTTHNLCLDRLRRRRRRQVSPTDSLGD